MRIAFDATTLHPPQTGVGYYSEHLLNALLKIDAGHQFTLVSNRPLDPVWRAKGAAIQEHGFMRSRGLWLQAAAPAALREAAPDVAHFTNSLAPPRSPCPLVVTVHDLSVALFPRLHPWRRRLIFPLVKAAMKRARRVITVSNSSRLDMVRLGVDPAKIEVVNAAAAPQFQPVEDAAERDRVRRIHGLPDRFLLFLGTIEPRKNLKRLIAAYRQLPEAQRRGCPLVLAGPPGWGLPRLTRDLGRSAWGSHIRYLGYVPFADLPALYSLSEAFVFPSLYEGFGLPVVEAMACGAPVITSSRSSMLELFEGAALLVDPDDAAALSKTLGSVLDSPNLRRELSEKSLVRAGRFSWERAAERTLDVYSRSVG